MGKDKKKKAGVSRLSFTRLRDIDGQLCEVQYHYYPTSHKLFALIGGSVKMSYAGKVATNLYNRLMNEKEPRLEAETGRA